MSSNDMIEMLECAVQHECALKRSCRCAVCELGFKFIVVDPIQLTCGHTICFECKKCLNSNKINCMKHGEATVGLESELSKQLLKMNVEKLFEKLKNEFETSIKILEETKIKFETQLKTTINDLKDNIDLKVEELKSELENVRLGLHNKIDDSEKQILSQIGSFNVSIDDSYDDLVEYINENKNLEITSFNKFQMQLKEKIDELQRYLDCSYTLQFEESDVNIKNLELIGSILFNIENKDIEPKWHVVNKSKDETQKLDSYLLVNTEEVTYSKDDSSESFNSEFELKNAGNKPIAYKILTNGYFALFKINRNIIAPNEKSIIKSMLKSGFSINSKSKVKIKYKVLEDHEAKYSLDEINEKIFKSNDLCKEIILRCKQTLPVEQ